MGSHPTPTHSNGSWISRSICTDGGALPEQTGLVPTEYQVAFIKESKGMEFTKTFVQTILHKSGKFVCQASISATFLSLRLCWIPYPFSKALALSFFSSAPEEEGGRGGSEILFGCRGAEKWKGGRKKWVRKAEESSFLPLPFFSPHHFVWNTILSRCTMLHSLKSHSCLSYLDANPRFAMRMLFLSCPTIFLPLFSFFSDFKVELPKSGRPTHCRNNNKNYKK